MVAARDSSDRPESERILLEIDSTRDDIDETLDALGERFQPDRAVEPILGLIGQTVRRSPVGSVAVAVLLGVLAGRLAARRRHRRPVEERW